MKAAVLRAPGDLVVSDVPDPELTADDVIVRVEAAGICGSDLASYRTGAYVRPGQVLGHEFAGVVVAASEGVQIATGVRVAVRPTWQCGACSSCRRSLSHVCDLAIRNGIGYGLPGAFAEFVRVPVAPRGRNLLPLPVHVNATAGALVEPSAVALHAVRRVDVAPDAAVVVLGLGPVGLAAVQMLRATGLTRIVGVDASPLRRGLARRLGATTAVEADDLVAAVVRVAGAGPRGRGGGADAVIEASGSAVLLARATEVLRTGGRIVLVALHGSDAVPDINDVVTREIDVVGCFGYDLEFADALTMIDDGVVDPSPLVTGTYELNDLPLAFRAQSDPHRHVKAHVVPVQ